MKTRTRKLALGVGLLLGALASSAHALLLSIGDAAYVGSVNDGVPANPGREVLFINALVGLPSGSGDAACATTETCNREGSSLDGLPTATSTDWIKDDSGATTVASSGYGYVLGKYDAGNAGSLVWFLGGLIDEVTLPGTFKGLGLSHVSLYYCAEGCTPTNVPEAGTLGLLGVGLLALGLLRRNREA